ncbi:MAG: 16S rRNA (guanine(966)-N(2))-methyltransferase RsmD [Arenicellales bacterium]|nr:16S rRNA (guanine(966)-N(2))-methyltransferase RsmD [Arenicellales bacterium]MDP7118816.1 16S rRNA (guanine(966)-N(2))-methyltransferase RsmD [Arenicellales bacterium]MDP7192068.1 16S rRNA (guanine(966)-N(2))-methyltransferase RsmD [Arenicellales bacterium]MDP7490050.1 16S rRNA (guanine(966)-N(2))-methyltransferase RsmD [Arenicellales bacterium]MDP7563063.1 16S rRNA (guanine(966)-N(2))-methyltransferase RsmD [Arenicellales bacterium]|tara:strand:+ start:497 stop:1099 length:603 start_codon:yes stop_codon:yes gene_type:complete
MTSQHRRGKQHGRLRIIAGRWKRRTLHFRGGQDLRPTPDAVRETLFNWLAPVIEGTACLDLFAGSGVLGLEAVSRGAASVTLVEQRSFTCEQLEKSVRLLGANNVTVQCADALDWLDHCRQRYDIIFVDPPYDKGLAARSLRRLARYGIAKENSLVYVETARNDQLMLPDGWSEWRSRQASEVNYRLYRVESSNKHANQT